MDRRQRREEVLRLLRDHRVVALVGPRQAGKTTLAREVFAASRRGRFFDLERPEDLAQLADPMLALGRLKGLVVLDEVHRRPELFPVLRVLTDRAPLPARFLVLGSASPELLRQSSESLAGRIYYVPLDPLTLDEVGPSQLDRLWRRGGFPRSFLARTEKASLEWREGFVTTFLERDVPQFGIQVPAFTLRRFWTMLAHYHGRTWNSSAFGSSFGVADTTVRRYLDVLTSLFVLRLLPAWSENLAKRQVKAPKVYLGDSGLLHFLLGIRSQDELLSHPMLGASWEGFAIGTVLRRLAARPGEYYFWATQAGAELDLFVIRGRQRLGFEFKRTSVPTLSKSMHAALADLRLDRLDVIHAGDETFPLAERVRAVPLHRVFDDVPRLK